MAKHHRLRAAGSSSGVRWHLARRLSIENRAGAWHCKLLLASSCASHCTYSCLRQLLDHRAPARTRIIAADLAATRARCARAAASTWRSRIFVLALFLAHGGSARFAASSGGETGVDILRQINAGIAQRLTGVALNGKATHQRAIKRENKLRARGIAHIAVDQRASTS